MDGAGTVLPSQATVGPRRRSVVGAGLAVSAGATIGAGLGTTGAQAAGRGATASGSPQTRGRTVYEEMAARWVDVLIGGTVPERHRADHAAAVAAQDRAARGYLDTIRTGSGRTTPWDELPLGESAGPSSHVTKVATRLRAIAVSCATPSGRLYRDPEAAAATAAGIRVLTDSVYHPGQGSYGNWWDWEIGTPTTLGDTCVLLGEALPTETLDEVLAAVDHFVPDPTRMLRDTLVSTGANRVDLCRAVALRGVLGRAPEKLTLAAESLAGVLDPVLIGDGFHPDGSFVMHTCVAYPGTYGQVLLRGMTELMRLLTGTEWDVAAAERARTLRAVEDTFVPVVYEGIMVDSVRGRAVSRQGARDADDGFLLTVDLLNLADALPSEQSQTAKGLRSLAKGWLERTSYRPLSARQPVQIATVARVLADDAVPPGRAPQGHFAFPDMERVVHRRERWTYSLALNSDRIARYEYMNGENARGWHTGDGMAQLYLDHDRFQYTDEFWPTVDATRLPGTTVDTRPLPTGAGGDNDQEPLTGSRWSGMVRLAPDATAGAAGTPGGLGLAGMDLRGTDSPLRARTSWLFLDDAVLTAGSGIRASGGRRIETVVDNRSLHAPEVARPVRLTVNGRPVSEAPGTTVSHPAVRWAHLGETGGYVFLCRDQELLSRCEDRTGRWRDLNANGGTTEVTRRYLTLWHDHGVDPASARYAHLVLPGASFAGTAARAGYPGVEVVALTEDVHAFRTTPGGLGEGRARLTAVNFFAAGTAAGVTADGPCAVLLLATDDTLRVAVSDPSRTAPVVTVTVDPTVSARYPAVRDRDPRLTVLGTGHGQAERGAGLELLAETGGSHGATLTTTLTTGRPAQPRSVLLLRPVADATVWAGARSGENDGHGAVLTVRHTERADDTSRSYLRFALPSPATGTIQRAVLWVRGRVPQDPNTREDDMAQTTITAHDCGTDWTESGLTWDTAPPPGTALGSGQLTVYDDWTGLDVTAAVQRVGAGPLALALSQPRPSPEARLNSREATTNGPLLEVVTATDG